MSVTLKEAIQAGRLQAVDEHIGDVLIMDSYDKSHVITIAADQYLKLREAISRVFHEKESLGVSLRFTLDRYTPVIRNGTQVGVEHYAKYQDLEGEFNVSPDPDADNWHPSAKTRVTVEFEPPDPEPENGYELEATEPFGYMYSYLESDEPYIDYLSVPKLEIPEGLVEKYLATLIARYPG